MVQREKGIIALIAAFLPLIISPVHNNLICHFQLQHDEDEIANWVGKHAQAALDLLLPPRIDSRLEEDAEWLMSVRVCPPYEPESRLCVIKRWNGIVEAFLDQPKERSIDGWLEYLHKIRPKADLEDIIHEIVMKKIRTDSMKYPRISRMVEELIQLEVPVIPPSELELDVTSYEVSSKAPMSSNRLDLVFDDTDNYALGNWVIQFIDYIQKSCDKYN